MEEGHFQKIDQGNISKPAIKERLQGSEEGRALVDLIKKKDQLKGRDVWKVIVDRLRTEISYILPAVVLPHLLKMSFFHDFLS
jgi:hypothetical protein